MKSHSSRAGKSILIAPAFLAAALGASACAEETMTIHVRDPREVGVNLRTAAGSVPVIEPGSDHRLMDPVPVEPRGVVEEHPGAHVDRTASGEIVLCCFMGKPPDLAGDPTVISTSVAWPTAATLGNGDALRVPFDYDDGRGKHLRARVPLEMVTPWSNVISVHDSRGFDRGSGLVLSLLSMLFGGIGVGLAKPESRAFGVPAVSYTFVGLGSVGLVSGLIMLLAPRAETEWRSRD